MDRRATLPAFPPDDLGDASNLPSLRQLFPEHLRMEAANFYNQQQLQHSVQEAPASRQSAYPAQIQHPQQQQGLLSPSPMSGYPHPSAHPQQYAYATQPSPVQPAQGSSQGVLLPAQATPRELDSKYDCPYCGKRFDRPSSVKIHITSHTGEKPFVCAFPGCGRRFSVNSNMRRHLRTHAAQPTAASSHDPPDAEEDDAPRASQHRQPRSAPAPAPPIPPIMSPQPPPPPPPQHPHPQSPATPASYQQYQLQQQQQAMLSAQAPMRAPSQPQPPQHGAAMLHSQPQHQAPPGVAMPQQYAGYAAYGQYGGYAQATPESMRWMAGAGMHQGGHPQPDYAPR